MLLPGGRGEATAPADAGSGSEHHAVLVVADITGARGNVEMLQCLIDSLVSNDCIDTDRIGLIGVSASSVFTAELAEASEGIVAAMAVGSGIFPPQNP